MYYDSKERRVLMRNGESIVSAFEGARRLLKGDLSVKVVEGDDTSSYKLLFGEDLSGELEDVHVPPSSHEHTDDDLVIVYHRILKSPRLQDNETEAARIEQEMDYFEESRNILFLIKLISLIDRFKKEGVVWGVGRGSACASYVLYLLEVHDVDPIKYNIPFSEMSKQQESSYDN